MFDPTSRYYSAPQYPVKDSRGRTVSVVSVPAAPNQGLLGYYLVQQGQRIDHIAYKYLNDPNGYWRIAEMNNVMTAETLTEWQQVAVPQPI
jgi:hypothetical protein